MSPDDDDHAVVISRVDSRALGRYEMVQKRTFVIDTLPCKLLLPIEDIYEVRKYFRTFVDTKVLSYNVSCTRTVRASTCTVQVYLRR